MVVERSQLANSSQLLAWRRAIEVIDETTGKTRTLALFPEERSLVATDADSVQVRLSQIRLSGTMTPRHPPAWASAS